MRRVALVLAFATALVAPAAPAFATIHPLVCAEVSNAPAGTPADTQNPPGLTPGGVDQSSATTAQPVVAVTTNSGTDVALKPEGC
jgi:hypothetical protein